MNEMDQFRETYFQECEELLGELEQHLLTLEDDGTDIESLHAVFRAIHSIKGGAGAFGFDRLVAFAHTFETTLDLMRDGQLPTSAENVELSVRAADIVTDLFNATRSGEDLPSDYETEVVGLLQGLLGGDAPVPPSMEDAPADDFADLDAELGFTPVAVDLDDMDAELGFTPVAVDIEETPPSEEPSEGVFITYTITFKPHPEMLKRGNEPLLLVREMSEAGAVKATPDLSALPELDAIQSDDAYISWTFVVISNKGQAAVEEAFDFVLDDCDFEISSEEPEVEAAPPELTLVAAPVPEKPAPKPASKPAPPGGKQTPTVSSVRVDLDKMDRMVNMVGELVITQAMLVQQGGALISDQHQDLIKGIEELTHHTRELQDGVMAMRAQAVKSVFQRMPRLVRELSTQTGKKIHLVMSGENTEIDKTVIEQLGDPLTHMIRNAADHGIEKPEVREAAGKPPEGTIHLSAEHRSGKIVIEITDDGAGINRERVFALAVEKGIHPADAKLTDEEIDNLIFAPGFSTATEVSNLSGRGVGMDVVISNIKNLGGRVMIQSSPGEGSRFTMTLPLTLAVMDGMAVRSGLQNFVLPLANIIESLRPDEKDVHPMAGGRGGMVLCIRGEYIQLVFLNQIFGIPDALENPWEALVIIVESEEGGKVGLVVDEILGQQQVVIKSLEENFDHIKGVAGATILGSGRVALILDVGGLKFMADEMETRGTPTLPVSASASVPESVSEGP